MSASDCVEMSVRLMAIPSNMQKFIDRGQLRQEAFADIYFFGISAETEQLTADLGKSQQLQLCQQRRSRPEQAHTSISSLGKSSN